MATPYDTEKNETTGRGIADEFNERYDTLYQEDFSETKQQKINGRGRYQTTVANVWLERSNKDAFPSAKRMPPGEKTRTSPTDTTPSFSRNNPRLLTALKAAKKKIETNEGLFKKGDELKIIQNVPKEKPFPVFIISLAILKDFLDVLDVSIIGIIFTTITSLLIGAILFLWVFKQGSGGWWKKRILAWAWKRYLMVFILELLPFFKMIPATTIFIFMVHYREKKLVKIANTILEELHKAGFSKLS